ncbi:MAG: response regulator, partial [bacterium]|nr:response regulator [bacterium]
FNAWVEEGIRDFVSEGEERGVRVVLDADKRITMVPFDIRKCDIVLNNLVMNALKHSPTGTTMTVRTLLEKDHVRVEVSDEGTGLQPGDEKELFTRFYQGAKESTGTGLGLAYSKVLLEQHKGTIGAYNNATKGATFYFTLPLTQEQVIAEAPSTEVEQKSVEQPEFLEEAGTKKLQQVEQKQEKYDYTILVVDDQESITQFLHDALKESFKEVLTAKDGVEAMKVLQNNRPDAVISDVMMPRMDGYELCRRIKSDLNISHIPVLLLTAKTDEHSIQVGYKTGADAYLPKPFDLEVLKQIVLNQLNTRQRVQDKYSTPGVVPLPEEVTISYADETFLKKLNELIEQHIDNTSLDIALIEMEMGMSRASIFNKMKSLTGMGCNEYITKIRMEKAIRFVKESALSFTEISERVGYNTASYFSTAFKQYTGMTPTQYRKKAKAEE